MAAAVRVSGPPNSSFVIGYPGVSATLPRVEGKVEIRPSVGVTAPVHVSLVTVCLQRRESINPSGESVRTILSSHRKEMIDIIGKEMLLFRCPPNRETESVLSMDLPFVILLPTPPRVPPASLQLPSRTAETLYELVVTVQQGAAEQKKYSFPVPLVRYDTLSSFGMYMQPKTSEHVSDHIITLGVRIERWSFGPLDPVGVYIKISPNPDWMSKAKKVTIQKVTIGIDEEITYNHEGDEPTKKVRNIAKQSQTCGFKMPEAGYMTNMGLVFPAKDLRDNEGINPRGKKEFPQYTVNGFTTNGTLYKIDYYLTVKATMSKANDISVRQPIVVSPFDHGACKQEMEAIQSAVEDAKVVRSDNIIPAPRTIVRGIDPGGLKSLGIAMFGGQRKPIIE